MRLFPQITSPFSMSSYPNQTLSQFENVDFYQRLTPETLFFIFYYMEVDIFDFFRSSFIITVSYSGYESAIYGSQSIEK